MKPLTPRLRGTIEISCASVGFGFLGLFGKWAFQSGLHIGEFLSYRFVVAAVILWAGLLLFRPHWIRLNLKQIFIAALLGIFGYALFSTLYFTAIDGLSITLAALLLYTYPFWVNIFSHFFTHDKVSKHEWAALAVASAGLVALLWGHIEVRNLLAVLAGLASGISYAIYVMVSGRLQKNVRPMSSALYVITFGALALSLVHAPNIDHLKAMTPMQATSILGIAIICTIMPLTFELAALQKLKSYEVALLMMIEPVTAAIIGAVVFQERLTLIQVLGAFVILGALAFNTIRAAKVPPVPSTPHQG